MEKVLGYARQSARNWGSHFRSLNRVYASNSRDASTQFVSVGAYFEDSNFPGRNTGVTEVLRWTSDSGATDILVGTY